MRNNSKTLTPKIGDKLTVNVNNNIVNLRIVERTSCSECYLYGKGNYVPKNGFSSIRNSYRKRCGCYNFEGNNQGIWINCGRKYRPDHKDTMMILSNEEENKDKDNN